jgi:hypothetical protein
MVFFRREVWCYLFPVPIFLCDFVSHCWLMLMCVGICRVKYIYLRLMVSLYQSVDEKGKRAQLARGAPGCAWGGEAQVLQELVSFTRVSCLCYAT